MHSINPLERIQCRDSNYDCPLDDSIGPGKTDLPSNANENALGAGNLEFLPNVTFVRTNQVVDMRLVATFMVLFVITRTLAI